MTGRVPLPCHGVQDTYTCAWCCMGIPRHSPTAVELRLVATIYGASEEAMRWAVDHGVHPGTDEIGRLLDSRGVGRPVIERARPVPK